MATREELDAPMRSAKVGDLVRYVGSDIGWLRKGMVGTIRSQNSTDGRREVQFLATDQWAVIRPARMREWEVVTADPAKPEQWKLTESADAHVCKPSCHNPCLLEKRATLECRCWCGRECGCVCHDEDFDTGRATADLGMAALAEFCLVDRLEVACTALSRILREAESWHSIHGHSTGSTQCDSICELIPEMKRAMVIAQADSKEESRLAQPGGLG